MDEPETYTEEQLQTALGVLSGRLDTGSRGCLDSLGYSSGYGYTPSPDSLRGRAEEIVMWWILKK